MRSTDNAMLPYLVVDASGTPVEAVSEFLRELVACDSSPTSVRSYAFDLLRWFRFLAAVGVDWSRASRVEVRDFVTWLRMADNPQRARHRPGRPPAGSVNARTGKRYLASGYAPATINHALSVLSAFYAYHIEVGTGPLVSPVPWAGRGPRVHAHHNPMEPFAARRRGAYRQKLQPSPPRAIPDELFAEVFATMTCHRDRALLSFYVSSCARPSELLGMTGADVDYGEQRIAVVSKGSRAREWVPASPESFVWLALYLADGPKLAPGQPLWWT
ncbi:MAG: tyrosine-type recombinase/integrase, partial [Acidimicrobiales bacterium]